MFFKISKFLLSMLLLSSIIAVSFSNVMLTGSDDAIITDLGYGPRLDTLHWNGSIQNVIQAGHDVSIFSKYFDGARGEETVKVNVTTYRDCDDGELWVEPDGNYMCFDNTVYRCHYGLSAEFSAQRLNFPFTTRSISMGGIVRTNPTTHEGYVCVNSASGYIWKSVTC